jgi:hypothetical protein
MEGINEIVDNIGDTFKGIFTGGASFSEMSMGKKVAIIVGVGLLVIVLLALGYYLYTTLAGFSSTRGVGTSACCTKSQTVRQQLVEAALSEQDMQQSTHSRIRAGMPPISSYAPGGYLGDNDLGMYDNTMGFTATKPTADDSSARSDAPCCGQPIVRPQVPFSLNMRPSYNESDFINMAYSN